MAVSEWRLPEPPHVAVSPNVPPKYSRLILYLNPSTSSDLPQYKRRPIHLKSGNLIVLILTESIVWRPVAAIWLVVLVVSLVFNSTPIDAATIAIPALYISLLAISGIRLGESRKVRALREHREQFIIVGELDGPCREFMARTQRAINVILDSEVQQAGLLDDIRNKVILPRMEWEIAQRLRGITRLRKKHDANMLGSLQKAIHATESDVVAIERYADHVRAADVEYVLFQTKGASAIQIEELANQARIAGQALQDDKDPATIDLE